MSYFTGPPEPYYTDALTPDDVAKMASAGVKIEWEDIQHRVNAMRDYHLNNPQVFLPADHSSVLLKELEFRMKWPEKRKDGNFYMSPAPEFDFVACHRAGDKVHIFVVRKGEPVTITEDWALFPSDALVTQLRVLGDTP